jgi:hypothetical protein
MVRVLGFLGFRDSMFAGLREEGRGGGKESTGGGRWCVGGRQGGGMSPARVVVVGGRAWSRAGASPSEMLGERGGMGIRSYRCLASLEGAPGGSPAGGGGGGAEAATAPLEPGGSGGGGTWLRRVSVGTWRTLVTEAAGARGGV